MGCFGLSRHLSYFSSSLLFSIILMLLPTRLFLSIYTKKGKRKTNYWSSAFFNFWVLVSYLVPFFFCPFLLDFFLVAIISWSFYVYTIINDFLLICPQLIIQVSFLEDNVCFHRLTRQLLSLAIEY